MLKSCLIYFYLRLIRKDVSIRMYPYTYQLKVHFWDELLGPFLGTNFGVRFRGEFWGTFLGMNFGVRFWGRILGSVSGDEFLGLFLG